MKKTPLYDVHLKMGAKMTGFEGWILPVQYSSIIQEHQTVRKKAGLFDVSHMGKIMIKGDGSYDLIQALITNNIADMKDYQAVYSPLCYPDGGIVDDILVYKFNSGEYLLVTNASNTEKDLRWIMQNAEGKNVLISDVTYKYVQIALQGPGSESILQKLTNKRLDRIKFYHFTLASVQGIEVILSRTGYTGEDGFEIYTESEYAESIWNLLLEYGRDEGLLPAGLGARDTLRLEASLPLYGQEISQHITPLEAGITRFVKFDKDEFIGKDALVRQKEEGISRKLVGFEMMEKGIPRSHYDVFVGGKTAGFVTSGSYSPTLNKTIGLAMVGKEFSKEGEEIDIAIRNRKIKARVVKTPFYNKKYKNINK